MNCRVYLISFTRGNTGLTDCGAILAFPLQGEDKFITRSGDLLLLTPVAARQNLRS